MFVSLCLSSKVLALWCIRLNKIVMAAKGLDKGRGEKARFKFLKYDCEIDVVGVSTVDE
jgi:hypothetical protein